MNQTPKKRRLPKNIALLSDHDFMTKIVGRKAMESIDKLIADKSKMVEKSKISQFIK